ncbi:zinc ribbon domain-containing protein, partial [Streptomyces mirabilis]
MAGWRTSRRLRRCRIRCGVVCTSTCDELPLSVREWTCEGCGIRHDRDHNAAQN